MSNVLLTFDRTAGFDYYGNNWYVTGTINLNKSIKKFGRQSAQVSNSNYLSLNHLNLGGKDFTIDYWANTQGVVTLFALEGGNCLFQYMNFGLETWMDNSASTAKYASGLTWSHNVWHHIAVVYDHANTTVKTYIDGVLKATKTHTIANKNWGPLTIGKTVRNGGSTAYIDHFRITDGTQLWTEAFAPPVYPEYNGVCFPFITDMTDLQSNQWDSYGTPSVSTTNAFYNGALQLDASSYLVSKYPFKFGPSFTIEGWFRATSFTNEWPMIFSAAATAPSNTNRIFLSARASDGGVGYDNNGSACAHFTCTFALNTTYHFAYVYDAPTKVLKVYINGVQKYSGTVTINNVARQVVIGQNSNLDGCKFVGVVDYFAIHQGFCKYTAAFTPPKYPPGLPITSITSTSVNVTVSTVYGTTESYGTTYKTESVAITPATYATHEDTIADKADTQEQGVFDLVDVYPQSLLHFDSAVDYDAACKDGKRPWTVAGSAALTTTNAKFGGNCLNLPSGAYLQSRCYIGGQDFTIDGWCYFGSGSGNYSRVFDLVQTDGSGTQNILFYRQATNNTWGFNANGTVICTFGSMWNQLVHFAVTYTGGKAYAFINGVLKGSLSVSLTRMTRNLRLGKSSYSADGAFIGQIDEFRILDGVALWTGNFTPPTIAGNLTINIPLPAQITGTHVATNGLTYYYKVDFSNVNDTTAQYVVSWGTSTSYGQTYTTKTETYTTANYLTAYTTMKTNADTQVANLKTYLNTLIGTVSVTDGSSSSNPMIGGGSIYFKVTASGSNTSITATSCTVTVTGVYGTSTSYGSTYRTTTHTITSANYSTYTTDVNNIKSTIYTDMVKNLVHGVRSLLSFESATTTDSISVNTWTATGTPTIATTNAKFSKALNIANGQSIRLNNIFMGYADFTVDCWFYGNNSMAAYGRLFECCMASNSTKRFEFTKNSTSANFKAYAHDGSSGNEILSLAGMGAIYHLGWTYLASSGLHTIFINGVQKGTMTRKLAVGEYNLAIGTGMYSVCNFIGNVDEFRIIQGLRLWTANFTPPTIAGNTSFNVPLPAQITGTYVATNGLTYYYRTSFTNSNATTAQYVTEWGTSTSYGQTYSTSTTSFTSATYTTAATTLTTNANTQINNLKNYLNTLIGTVTVPATKTGTYATSSGSTIYYKAECSAGTTSITATSHTVTIGGYFGTSTSYGTTYLSESYTITPSNYSTYSTELTNRLNAKWNAMVKEFTKGVRVLMHFDSALLTDDVGNLWTQVGTSTALSATNAKFGGKCAYFNGTSAHYIWLPNPVVVGGDDDFTIDFWGYISSSSRSWGMLFTIYPDFTSNAANRIYIGRSGTSNIFAYDIGATGNPTIPNTVCNTLYHVAMVYDGTNKIAKYYINGVQQASKSVTIGLCIRYLAIGGTVSTGGGTDKFSLNGYVDEFRYTKGIKLWTANFTPPTIAGNTSFNVPLPAATTGTYAAKNGTTYYYRVNYSNTNATTAQYQLVWGTSTSYGQTYSTSTTSFTSATYLSAATTLTTNANTPINNLKAYLDKLVGTISAPAAATGSFTAANGKTYYYKHTYSGGNTDLLSVTSCTLTCTTTFDTSTAYANTFKTDSTTITVTNRASSTSLVQALGTTHLNNLKTYLTPSVKSLLSFDSATTTDSVSGNTWTATGTVGLDTSVYKFGKGLKTTANSGYLELSSGVALGAQDFTIDGWVKQNGNKSDSSERIFEMVTTKKTNTSQSRLTLLHRGCLCLWSTSVDNSAFNSADNVLHHFAVVHQYSDGITKVFIDGVLKQTWGANVMKLPYATFYAYLGWNAYANAANSIDEYYDDFKITNGVKLWWDNFTPPTIASNTSFNVPLPPTITGSHTATNKTTYYYRVTFSNTNATTAQYKTEWGTSTSYGQTYSTSTTSFTSATYLSAATTLTTNANTQITNLKNYLNTLVGTVTAPAASADKTHTATNGITYHYKFNYSGGNTSITATSCTVTASIVWGTSTSYGQTYQTINTTVTASNATTYTTGLNSSVSTQETNLKNYLNTLIGTITESSSTGTFTAASTTYYYKTTQSGSNTSITATSCTITTITQWGRTASYGQEVKRETLNIVASNYTSRNTTLNSRASTQLTNLKADLELGIKVLLHFENGLLTDDTGMTWTTFGSPTNASTAKFGSKSLYPNNGNYGIESARPVILEDRNWTIDWWEYVPSSVTGMIGEIISIEGAINDPFNANTATSNPTYSKHRQCLEITYYPENSTYPTAYLGLGNGQGWKTTSIKCGNNVRDQWVHRAIVRNGTTVMAFENGVLINSVSPVSHYMSVNNCAVQIGFLTANGARVFKGYIDEVRIVRGYALWTESFTPSNIATVLDKMVLLPGKISGTYIATNGITYYYQTTFSNDSNIIGRYTTVWGISTSYGQTYSNKTTTFTDTNYSNSQVLLKQSAETEITALKTYLNTLIGTVTAPASAGDITYTATNGTTYHYKSTFSGSSTSITATSCTVTCTTVWGDTTSYGQTYGTTTTSITASTYKTYASNCSTAASTQEGNLKTYLNTLVGKITAPAAVTGEYTPTTNKIKYYYKTTYTGGNSSITATACTLTATTVWGTSTSYGQTYATDSISVTPSTASAAITNITVKKTTQVSNLQTYLATLIGVVSPPAASTGTFVIDSTTYTYNISHSGSNSSITATSCNVTTQITWHPGDTSKTQTFKKETLNIVPSNYSTYSTTLSNKATPFLNELKAALTPGIKNLLHFEDSLIKDETGKTWILVGSPTHSSDKAKFGTKSIHCDTKNSMVKIRAMLLENKSWTIDFWEYLPGSLGTTVYKMQLVAFDYDDGRDAFNFSTLYYTTANPVYYLGTGNSSWDSNFSNTTMGQRLLDQWVHRAVVRNGNNISVYQNGILQSSKTITRYFIDTFDMFMFIGNYALDNNRPHKGYIDEVRFTKGYALWTADFTVPDRAGDANTMVALPATITGSHTATNGTTYYYKTTFSTDSNTVGRYKTEWGTSTSYGQTYSDKTTTFTTANYMNSQASLTSLANTEIENLKNFLNTLVGVVTAPDTEFYTYTATNGITYNCKTAYSGGNTDLISTTSCTLITDAYWSTDTSYINHRSNDSLIVTISNRTTAESTIISKADALEIELKEHLDTLIGPVILPAANTEVYTSESGKKFYLRTQYSKKSLSYTECTVTYATDWGFTNSYGTSYSSKTHQIVASNYQTWTTDLTNNSIAEFTSCHSNFALWDISLPSNTSEDWTSLGKDNYKIKVTYTQGPTTDTSNSMNYKVSYIKNNGTEVEFQSGSETFTSSNYTNYTSILSTSVASVIEDLKYWINHPDISLPDNLDVTETIDLYWAFHIQIQFSKGSTVNIAVMKVYIDGVQYGSTWSKEYYTMESAASDLPQVKTNKYDEIMNILNTLPENANTDKSIGNMKFRFRNIYGKSADKQTCTIYVKVDEQSTIRNIKDHTLNINDLVNEIATIKSKGQQALNEEIAKLNNGNIPTDYSVIVTYGGFNFSVGVKLSKNVNTTNYTIITTLDGDNYSTDTFTTNINQVSTIATNATGCINKLKSILSNVPLDSYEIFNLVNYNWGIWMKYEKAANSHDVKKYILLDSVQYGNSQTTTFDINNISALSAYNANLKTSLKNLLTSNGAPEDIIRYRTIRGVQFGIKVTFSKEAEEHVIHISYFSLNRFISPKINQLPYDTSLTISDVVDEYATEEIIRETIDTLVEFTYEAAETAGKYVLSIDYLPDTEDTVTSEDRHGGHLAEEPPPLPAD